MVHLNIASNEISGKGMEIVFEGMAENESIVNLNVSTIAGANRNRVTR